jgi:two-component system, OmpR family, phosphate regulon response regulator PhoB
MAGFPGVFVLPALCFTIRNSELIEQLRLAFSQFEIRLIDESNFADPVNAPALYFIDWLMPGVAGLEMCRSLRDQVATRDVHITMLLDDDNDEQKKRALNAGADDYLIGPLTLEKLSGRLSLYGFQSKAKMGRHAISFGALEVDMTAFCARYEGNRIEMSPNELKLLAQFMENPDRALSRHDLIMMVGKDSGKIDGKTVDVWVGRLRKALRKHGGPDPIRSVKSVGYVFDSQILNSPQVRERPRKSEEASSFH